MNGQGAILGHDVFGHGPKRVVVLNDWMCDTSTWDGARAFLDGERFTWAFADLRGYGRSRGRAGAFTLAEATADVLALADALGWARCSLVGHSMSTLVALQLGQWHGDRLERIVLATPAPPAGMGADDARVAAGAALARADEATQRAGLAERFGPRLTPAWAAFKVARWRATTDANAAAGYVAMFAQQGLPEPTAPVACPVLALTGDDDVPPMRREAVTRALAPICRDLQVTSIPTCGHYPMQESPPHFVALVERFLAAWL